MRVFLGLVLCLVASGLRIYAPNPSPGNFPFWSIFPQVGLFESRNASLFFKNYSVAPININNCNTFPPANVAGKVIGISFSEGSNACALSTITRIYNPLNPIGYMLTNSAGAQRANGFFSYDPPSNDFPVWYVGAQDIPLNIALTPAYFPTGLLAANTTIFLDSPYENYVSIQARTAGSTGQIFYFSIGYGLFGMIVAIWKLSAFVHAYGIQLSIPQICIACAFCCNLIIFISLGLFGTYLGQEPGIVPPDAQETIYLTPYGFLLTGLTILGFYFIEISSLTSTRTIPGLDKLKIPAAIMVTISWIVIWATLIVNGTDPTVVSVSSNSVQLFYFAWLAVIVPFALTAVFVYGSVSLLLALKGSSAKSAVVRVSLLCALMIGFMWGPSLVGFLLNYSPPPLALTVTWGYMTISQYFAARTICWVVGWTTLSIILSLSFSISVQKEIEISKSGTSSTSSSGSSSSSSKSSSSSSDPVIEL